MKKFNLFAMVAIVLTIFSACQKDELAVEQSETVAFTQEQSEVYEESGYLVFRTLEDFNRILLEIEKMEDTEKEEWENSLNFKSAETFRNETNDLADNIKTQDEKNSFVKKYSDFFRISEDLDIRYKFYATGLASVLNEDGIIKIENSLYKFSREKEYIILDGDQEQLSKFKDNSLKSAQVDDDNVIVFESFSRNKRLKSTAIVEGGTQTVGKRRLNYSLEEVVFSTIVNFDPFKGLTKN
ncbi:DUF4848 domain-containing protein [uncultured Sunxiuqinia sp.]|uniref:DUF4848 domain-containing protein n=1 Tax=uncultured Sunxiuqinia sp. TaxID=1573825 RepID=UPI002AA6376B|nr:DUF4848 domain-containing protein [uncultured Sunxiuqinia sp.]